MQRFLFEESDWIDTNESSFFVERIESDSVVEGPANWKEDLMMTENVVNPLLSTLDARVAQLVPDSLIKKYENIRNDSHIFLV